MFRVQPLFIGPVEPLLIETNPCVPSPCGPNSQCRNSGGVPSCSCLPEFIGSPPSCKPECTINSECLSSLACIRQKCIDPCPGSCGISAHCSVINHTPTCTCLEGYTGDPFVQCVPKPPTAQRKNLANISTIVLYKIVPFSAAPLPTNPCDPSPCGPNSVCSDGICTCLPEHQGDPYEGCRPECVISTDCARDKACIRKKCVNPCPGTCGQNAVCNVINHIPMCSCQEGFTGNAFIACSKLEGILFQIFTAVLLMNILF